MSAGKLEKDMQSDVLGQVTLVIPTFNCRAQAERHLDSLGEGIDRFGEILVVDSYSTDGTYELLEGRLGDKAQIWQRERGLYGAWTAARDRATKDYLYISTVGDDPDLAELEAMAAWTINHQVGVTVSPPVFYSLQGKKLQDWPVHNIMRELNLEAPLLIEQSRARLLHQYCFAKFGVGPLTGSIASCLVRRVDCLPFVDAYGKLGDVIWNFEMAATTSWGLFPEAVARFEAHDPPPGKKELTFADRYFEALTECLANPADELAEVVQLRLELVEASIRKARRWKPLGRKKILHPGYWTHCRLVRQKKRLVRRLLAEVSISKESLTS